MKRKTERGRKERMEWRKEGGKMKKGREEGEQNLSYPSKNSCVQALLIMFSLSITFFKITYSKTPE